MPNIERLALLNNHGFDQNQEYENAQALNEFQIKEMAPFVNMQSHTLFHPILPKCKINDAKVEIGDSKKLLEEKYNLKINSISYPNGDYSMRDIKLSKDAGYECGITVDFGFNNFNADLFRLKRISVNDTRDLNELIVKSTGLWGFLKLLMGVNKLMVFTQELNE